MSRRKQPKPRHLTPDEDPFQTGVTENALLEALGEEEEGSGRLAGFRGGDTHVCEKCCAEFFTWSELWDHQSSCEEPPLVLIMKEAQVTPEGAGPEGAGPEGAGPEGAGPEGAGPEGAGPEEAGPEGAGPEEAGPEEAGPKDLHAGASPDPSSTPSDLADLTSTDEGFQGVNSHDTLEMLEKKEEEEEEEEEEESMELDVRQEEGGEQQTSLSPSPGPAHSPSPGVSAAGMPTTNVTLEILQSTRVAVAQFSQGIHTGRGGGRATTAAISAILDHLQALQQQQVLQLQMIEQVRSQVSGMSRQPAQAALGSVTKALPLTRNCFPSLHPSVFAPSLIPSSEMIPSPVNGQASVSLASVFERSHERSSPAAYGQSLFRDDARTPTSSAVPSSSCDDVSLLLPPYTGAYSGVKNAQTVVSSGPLSQGDTLQGSSSSSLPLLPQSLPSTVIFPNPLARIAATANAFEPLAIFTKSDRATLPCVSLFDTKPRRDEHFFKHKCRFCSKVFGSDSALQIHLRSHTGERPFKCNICGNRFSTKGNLKVHFQRHKDKYPHVQMNPYPVPEYLDSVPTSQGVSYGMSFPQEKTGSLWLDSKPVVATVTASTVTASTGLQLPSLLSATGNSTESASVTPSIKSSNVSVPSQRASLSPATSSQLPAPPPSESPTAKEEVESHNAEQVHLPQNCPSRPTGSSVSIATGTAPTGLAPTPQPSAPPSPYTYDPSPLLLSTDHFNAGFPFGGVLNSMETSETWKLQKLVENIDRKITDPNQCILCHRILSCQNALKMHYRVHTGERPFRCKVCGRTFTTKGNLKTHVGVHRASPPLLVRHSCPICQKKFTNAIVLQQHIRLHMAGHIPDLPHVDAHQGSRAAELSGNGKNTDRFRGQENDFADDNSMEDEEEEDEEEDEMAGNTEDSVDPFKALSSLACSPGKSSAVVSNIAALENQMKIIDSTSGLNHTFGMKSLMNSNFFTANSSCNPDPFLTREAENLSKTVSKSSRSVPVSPGQSSSEGHLSLSSEESTVTDSRDVAVSVKTEQSGSSPQNQTGSKPTEKDSPYSMILQNRDHAPQQNILSLVSNAVPSPADTELNGYGRPTVLSERHQHSLGLQIPAAKSCMWPSGPLFTQAPAPPRRMPKQHNCNMCGKNFSSASALQIHERTHTGEKPFGCSVCGRAFTTKGNLKVHMGTHMWNNSPARRGRRLSMENPMALLGGDAVKFGEMFQKDLAARAMNADAGFWNRYAAAITNSLSLKNNGMSVVQNQGITQLHTMTAGMESRKAGGSSPLSSLGNTSINLGANTHFSMLVDDSKNIGIN